MAFDARTHRRTMVGQGTLRTLCQGGCPAVGLAMAQTQSSLSGGYHPRTGVYRNRYSWRPGAPTDNDQSRPAFSGGIFVNPDHEGDSELDDRLFWHSRIDPSVLAVEAERISPSHVDAFDINRFAPLLHVLSDRRGREMVLLADGARQVQLDVVAGTVLSGPVRLRYQLSGFSHVNAKLKTIARLESLRRLGRFATGLFTPEPQGRKWIKSLQAYDGLTAGASQREIAIGIFGDRLVAEEWNGRSGFLRQRVQRLINYARVMVDGGYTKLFR